MVGPKRVLGQGTRSWRLGGRGPRGGCHRAVGSLEEPRDRTSSTSPRSSPQPLPTVTKF